MLRTGYGEETEIHLKQSCTCTRMSTNQDMFTCACVVNGYTHTDTLFAYFQSFVLTSYQTKTRPLLCRFVLEGNTSVSKSSQTNGVKRWFTLTPCAQKTTLNTAIISAQTHKLHKSCSVHVFYAQMSIHYSISKSPYKTGLILSAQSLVRVWEWFRSRLGENVNVLYW